MATCTECGCEFTFIKSDMQKELKERQSNSYASTLETFDWKEYVTCPCCHENVTSWKEYSEKSIKYRKKPVFMEAIQFLNNIESILKITEFMAECSMKLNYKDEDKPFILVETPEGTMKVYEGDYIIKNINGEFFSCKPDIFEKTYEKAE